MLPSSPFFSSSPLPLILPKKTNQKAEVEKNASKFQLGFNCDDDSRIHWRRIRINRYTGYGYSHWYSYAYSCAWVSVFFADCLPYWLRLKHSDLQHSLRFFRFIIIYLLLCLLLNSISISISIPMIFSGRLPKNLLLSSPRSLQSFNLFNLGGLSKFIFLAPSSTV